MTYCKARHIEPYQIVKCVKGLFSGRTGRIINKFHLLELLEIEFDDGCKSYFTAEELELILIPDNKPLPLPG